MEQKYPVDYYVKLQNVDYYLDIARHISYYRTKAGLTQKQLADKAGISRSYLSHLESPNTPHKCSLDTLFSICYALNIKPVDLFLPLP